VIETILQRLRSTALLRAALGLVYFHFGFLKFFPDLSPAELIASQTILRLGFDLDASYVLFVLGGLECAIGGLLLLGIWPRLAALLMLGHIIGTMTPLWVLPQLTFKFAPFAPTIEGQYILKNLVFVAAGLMILAERREPSAARAPGRERALPEDAASLKPAPTPCPPASTPSSASRS
jgi:uncharacterized membrane protein YkgB